MVSMMPVDVLMVVHARPEYSARTLPRLLDVCAAEGGRVWLWRNGDDSAVADVVERHLDHPALHRVHHEPANAPLRDATNWLWRESHGPFVGKVDDDCLVHPGWLATMLELHGRGGHFGALCAWHYAPEDFDEELAAAKIVEIDGVRLLRNLWRRAKARTGCRSSRSPRSEPDHPTKDGSSRSTRCRCPGSGSSTPTT